MKNIFYVLLFLLSGYSANAQVNQTAIGTSNVTAVFNSVKYDPNGGGTINAGYINDAASGTGNDCFMVKLNAGQKIVWQKKIPNDGDDYLNKVIICANGDYVAIGQSQVNGILRGFACRINKDNGNIIWSSNSNNSPISEVFFDVVETTNGNIAISGIDANFPGLTNTFIVLLNAAGNTLWSKVSSYPQSDGAFAINQLPNGNLVVGTTVWVGYYLAIILEVNELSGTITTENAYQISTTLPSANQYLNSIWPFNIKVKDGITSFEIRAFEDCCGFPSMCIYNYDYTNKQLSGNIYYYPGNVNPVSYAYVPVGNNDFLLSQSFINPASVYVSRVTNGTVIYDNILNDSILSINSIDTTAFNVVYAGQAYHNTFANAYNLFSPRNVPATNTDCDIAASGTLALQPSVLNPFAASEITLSPAAALIPSLLTSQTSAYTLSTICGSPLIETTKAPVVSITSPVNNAIYTAPATITLEADAIDDDGTISSVQFYRGSILIKTDSTFPYNCTVDSLAAGNYSFVAKATDNSGLVNNSATIAVFVGVAPNKAPFVNVTSPANNATYLANSTITLTADAGDPDGTITSVKFYNGSTLLKTDSTAPYNYTLYNTPAGNYRFFAKATDSSGLSNSSTTVSVFVIARAVNKAPSVSVTSPANNTLYAAPATITLNAEATDADGTVTRVQFYNGSTLLNTDSVSPYSFKINNVTAGNYSFTAKATDNNGTVSNSPTVAVVVGSATNKAPTVNITGPANNATYIAGSTVTIHATASDPDGIVTSVKFYNGTTLLKTDSSNPYSYTISNAAAGNYKIFAKATDNKGLANSSATFSLFVVPGAAYQAPVVNITSPANNTIYYAPAAVAIVAAASDPDGTITGVQFYNGSTLLTTDSSSPYSFTINSLAPGKYSFLATAIDNNGLKCNSATIFVSVLPTPNKAPLVNVSSPANNAIYPAPATITLSANATDIDGTIKNVKFYSGTTLLKTDSTSPYSYTLNNQAAGSYKFFAKATDNLGLANSSATVSVVVKAVQKAISKKASRLQKVPVAKAGIDDAALVKLAPNPAHNVVTIYTNGFKHKPLNIVIATASGVVVKTITTTASMQIIPLNISTFASGMYVVKISDGDKIIYKQFIKQ